MKPYQWILFDADETLFHFDAFQGLQLMFSRFDIAFTREYYDAYQLVNKALWLEYENGLISAQDLQAGRFEAWSKKLGCSPLDLNEGYLSAMAEICKPLPGVPEVLDALRDRFKLGIITNGFTQLQKIRLDRTGFKDYFDVLVISEQVGVAKPDKAIFDHTLALMGYPPREQVLMVGDNPATDILGGLRAGLDTCWLNSNQAEPPEGIEAHYQVHSLVELLEILRTRSKQTQIA